MLEFFAAGLIGPAFSSVSYDLPSQTQNSGVDHSNQVQEASFDPEFPVRNLPEIDTRVDRLDFDGDCRKLGRDTYLGRRLMRKECHLAATSAHSLGSGLQLEFQGRFGIVRSRGSASVELGDPKGTQLREFSAALVFADEWHLSSGRFERGGWGSESLEAIARQLSAGDELPFTSHWVGLTWSPRTRVIRSDGFEITARAEALERQGPPAWSAPNQRKHFRVSWGAQKRF